MPKGLQYYYYPFISRNDATLKNVSAKYRQKANALEINQAWLTSLDPRGTLLVDGHSNDGQHEISAQDGENWETIGVDALAGVLASLPKNFVAIRMLACYGKTFARGLALKLGATHQNIRVGGYTMSVFHAPGYRGLIDNDQNTTNSGYILVR
jgi:hypothetical protein